MHLPVRIHRRPVHKVHGLRAVHHRKRKARFHPHTMSLRGRAAVGYTLPLDTLHGCTSYEIYCEEASSS